MTREGRMQAREALPSFAVGLRTQIMECRPERSNKHGSGGATSNRSKSTSPCSTLRKTKGSNASLAESLCQVN